MAGRGIWDPAITAPPCRYPCQDWRHVHDYELPSNYGHRDGQPGDEDTTQDVR